MSTILHNSTCSRLPEKTKNSDTRWMRSAKNLAAIRCAADRSCSPARTTIESLSLRSRASCSGRCVLGGYSSQVKLSQLFHAVAAGLELFNEVLVWIANAFNLFALQSERFCYDRIGAILRDKKIGNDRFRLAITVQPADALLVHARTPIEFTENNRACDLLQAIEARSRTKG